MEVDKHHRALDVRSLRDVIGLQHADKLVQLLHDLRNHVIITLGDQGHAGDRWIKSLRNRQALDIEATRTEESDDARKLAVAVLHQDGKRVSHPRTISLMPAPGGTMGKTFSSALTTMSITTTPGVESPCSSTGQSSCGREARRPVAA